MPEDPEHLDDGDEGQGQGDGPPGRAQGRDDQDDDDRWQHPPHAVEQREQAQHRQQDGAGGHDGVGEPRPGAHQRPAGHRATVDDVGTDAVADEPWAKRAQAVATGVAGVQVETCQPRAARWPAGPGASSRQPAKPECGRSRVSVASSVMRPTSAMTADALGRRHQRVRHRLGAESDIGECLEHVLDLLRGRAGRLGQQAAIGRQDADVPPQQQVMDGDARRRRDRPLEGRGAPGAVVRPVPVVEDHGEGAVPGLLLAAHHEISVAGGRTPVDVTHVVAGAVLAGQDVVVASGRDGSEEGLAAPPGSH